MKKINPKELFTKYLDILVLIVIIVFLSIIFFGYTLNMTWDSSEYIGLADLIGTKEMETEWIGHRGIGFPWLVKLSQKNGIKSIHNLLSLMFKFYVVTIFSLYLIYKKLSKAGIMKNIILALAYVRILFIFHLVKSYDFWILSYCTY